MRPAGEMTEKRHSDKKCKFRPLDTTRRRRKSHARALPARDESPVVCTPSLPPFIPSSGEVESSPGKSSSSRTLKSSTERTLPYGRSLETNTTGPSRHLPRRRLQRLFRGSSRARSLVHSLFLSLMLLLAFRSLARFQLVVPEPGCYLLAQRKRLDGQPVGRPAG